MAVKKIPLRMCIVTREKLPKEELIRVVRTTDETVIIDLKGKVNGRGAYLKRSLEVVEKAKKTKVLDKHLEVVVPSEIYDEIIKIIDNN